MTEPGLAAEITRRTIKKLTARVVSLEAALEQAQQRIDAALAALRDEARNTREEAIRALTGDGAERGG